MKLKYGMNPYQKNATAEDKECFRLLNGNPGFINVLDALNSWQLVREIWKYDGSVAAASFKHVTPSGVAIAGELSEPERSASFVSRGVALTQPASAYLRARSSDRLAAFGDFIAVNARIDTTTAKIIRSEVSDGIIAPGYDIDALKILKAKKNGSYIIFEIDQDYVPPAEEKRTVFGFELTQDRNELKIRKDQVKDNIVTNRSTLPVSIVDDLCLGMITLKYTQSNSICIVRNGQVIGIGSGQQSRIMCTELAMSKAYRWFEKTRLDYTSIPFPKNATRTEKDQLVEQIRIERANDSTDAELMENLVLCSDGFFPQPDNIELAASMGVRFIAAPMGSIRDEEIIAKCDSENLVFCNTGVRLFHH